MPKNPASAMHANHRNRMRDKLSIDPDTLADHELLEMVLYAGIPRKNTNPIAHTLLARFGSLRNVLSASTDELCAIPNMTRSASYALHAFRELHMRAQTEDAYSIALRTPEETARFLADRLADVREKLYFVVCTDANDKVLYSHALPRGSAPSAADLSSILPVAIAIHPANLILCRHDPFVLAYIEPEDSALFAEIPHYLSALKIKCADYLISGAGGFYESLRTNRTVRTLSDDELYID